MKIGTAVANKVIQWAERRAVQIPRYAPSWLAGQIIHPEWSTEKAVKEGYKVHYALYTVASDLADCVRQVPWELKRQTKTGLELVDEHPLINMIRRPNPESSWGALCEMWDLYKSLAGNAYGVYFVAGETIQMWMLRPERVTIKPDPLGHIAGYDYSVDGGKPDFYPLEQICHFKFFNPGSDHYGLSPLQAAARLVDTSSAGLEWNYQSMGNRARPDGMIVPDHPLSKPQYELYRKMIDETMAGPANAHKVIIPSEPAKFVPFQSTPVEMDFSCLFEAYAKAIYEVYKVHPEAVGTSATFTNKEWAVRAKWEGPVSSRLREMRERLNHKFGPIYGTAYPPAVGDLFLDFDLSNIPAAIAARRDAAEEGKIYFSMGFSVQAINEKLGLGFDPEDVPAEGFLPAVMLPATSGRSERAFSVRGANIETEEQFAVHWLAIDRQKLAFERGVAAKVRERFRAEMRVVVKAIGDGQRNVDLVVDSQAGAWTELLTAVWRAVIEHFGQQTADDLSAGATAIGALETRYVFDPWTELIHGFVTAKVAEHVTHVGDATKRAIRKEVLDGLDANESTAQIARRIGDLYGDKWIGPRMPAPGDMRFRCAMIARTEVHSAAGFAMHESARQSNVAEEKHWYDSGDERVRETHAAATAEGWIPFEQLYSNGCMYPGDGPPEEVIMCRCVEAFRTRRE